MVGSVPDALGPSRIAVGPRGGRAFVTNSASNSVSAFNPATLTVVGAPITVGEKPFGIGIESSGTFAYATSPEAGTVSPFNAGLNAPIGGSLPFPGATGIALRPDGLAGYVTNAAGAAVSILDTTRNAAVGAIATGAVPTGVAFAPNQRPVASFWVSPSRRRAKRSLTFHGGGSTDDGRIATYAWDFGDLNTDNATTPPPHTYTNYGQYVVKLTSSSTCLSETVLNTINLSPVSVTGLNSRSTSLIATPEGQGKVTISGLTPNDHVDVYTINGQKAHSAKTSSEKIRLTLTPGIYFITTQNKTQKQTLKFSVE